MPNRSFLPLPPHLRQRRCAYVYTLPECLPVPLHSPHLASG
ncbi:MAG: hypothetical protein WAK28_15575 [Trebonia sp.]